LPCFCQQRWQQHHQFWWHLFCLRVRVTNPCFTPCYNTWQEDGINFGLVQ
jgi:hypothetical protein